VSQIEDDLRALGLENEPVSIRMTGCPNGCARPYMGDIGFVGRTKDIYNVYIGGDQPNTRLNTLYKQMVHYNDLAATVRPLLAIWRNEREAAETFGDFANRVGVESLRARVEAASATPVASD
jgi:sulfite reductase (ferredoxin)